MKNQQEKNQDWFKKKLKPRTCKNPTCKTKYEPYTTLSICCSIKCSLEYNKIQEEKKWQTKKKSLREKLKTISEHRKEARLYFQRFIRQRDDARGCISCNSNSSKVWHGGHYLKAELFTGLIFDETNCHKQCIKCNYYLDGNELGFREGLIARYGEEYVQVLEQKKITHRLYKFTKEELMGIKEKYKLLIK